MKKILSLIMSFSLIVGGLSCFVQVAAAAPSMAQRVKSPEWIEKLDAAKTSEQLIVVAGVGKTTATISMHEKNSDGSWEQIVSSPGFIGLSGLGPAREGSLYTPVGTFVIDKAFGIADDPGCKMDYIKVNDSHYWSGDIRDGMHYNELLNINDFPDLDKKNSEHLIDYWLPYQYCLNMGFNSKCIPNGGSAIFLHCFGARLPYTYGCVSVPHEIMKIIMQNVKPGCVITIDTLENFRGSL